PSNLGFLTRISRQDRQAAKCAKKKIKSVLAFLESWRSWRVHFDCGGEPPMSRFRVGIDKSLFLH
ncbi:MAG TPA: hypothetical protein VFE47_03505, partial [Tepidisphaeraceae bacterium]|nr:hypothetical protein [Tepidisphaeraceae bacterium]